MKNRPKSRVKRLSNYCLGALITAASFIAFPANASDSCPQNLIAYWRLGEASAPYSDQIGSLAGTCTDCPSRVTTGAVAGDGAQSFNGTNDEISVAAGASFGWSASDSFSIEVWMKSSSSGSDEALIARQDSANQTMWKLGILANGKARFTLQASNGDSAVATGTKVLNNGVWHHIAAVRGSNQIRLYVDGELENQVSHTYSAGFASDADLTFGWIDNASPELFSGVLDEVGIYNAALSEIDIRSHYFLSRQYCGLMETALKIMPLGDSITYDNKVALGTLGNSYRKPLWQDLNDNYFWVDFVGSQASGETDFDNEHEGHPGYTDDQIATNVQTYLASNPAEVVLLHIGTNAFSTSATDVENILDNIDSFDSGRGERITVVLARIIRSVDGSLNVEAFNYNVEAMAQARIADGDKIIMVDMQDGASLVYSLYTDGGDFVDNLHPYTSGYLKMSDQWYSRLNTFLPMVEPPVVTSDPILMATIGKLYTYQVVATGDPAPTFSLTTSPSGMTINSTTGLIQWTPGSLGNKDVVVKVQNTNTDWGSMTDSFTITVTNNNLPQITSTAPDNATVGSVFTYNATATDDDGDTLTWSLASGPSGMSIDATTGVVTWTPEEGDIGTANCSIEVSDGRGGSTTQNFTLTITSGNGNGVGDSGTGGGSGGGCFVQSML